MYETIIFCLKTFKNIFKHLHIHTVRLFTSNISVKCFKAFDQCIKLEKVCMMPKLGYLLYTII